MVELCRSQVATLPTYVRISAVSMSSGRRELEVVPTCSTWNVSERRDTTDSTGLVRADPLDGFFGIVTMTEHLGPLATPQFGELPRRGSRLPLKRFIYADLLETLRQHPEQSACIGVFEKGHSTLSQKTASQHVSRITAWLKRFYPLEAWEVHQRRIQPTWNRVEIWACYRGELTPEQMRALREARSVTFQTGKRNSELKRNARDAVARLLAEAKIDGTA